MAGEAAMARALKASLGTVPLFVTASRCRRPSKLAKKKVLSLKTGPPRLAPNWFRRNGGFPVLSIGRRASSLSLRKYSNAPP